MRRSLLVLPLYFVSLLAFAQATVEERQLKQPSHRYAQIKAEYARQQKEKAAEQVRQAESELREAQQAQQAAEQHLPASNPLQSIPGSGFIPFAYI